MMKQLHADDAAAALKDFKERQAQFELDWRVESTLSSLQQLALYLSGIHGRKNVIWPVERADRRLVRNAFECQGGACCCGASDKKRRGRAHEELTHKNTPVSL